MIRIAAVDDEMHALERFAKIVLDMEQIELCGLFETEEQLLSYLKEHPLDAVFLDIEMPGINGLQLSEQILDLNEDIDIIFVTAFNQYAIEAFEVQAVDYIMKPLTEERLSKTISRLLKKQKAIRAIICNGKPMLQCFGSFEVLVDGKAITWKNTKAKEILAFLVHKKGEPVNWEKIADAVWPDYDAEKAHTNFHATTYLLRKRLAQAGVLQILENSRGNYRILTDQVNCDIYQLEELIKNNRMKRKEDLLLFEQLNQRGYMEESGYAWAYPRAAELDKMCKRVLDGLKKNK
jgi:two-component SAPR family response regulator